MQKVILITGASSGIGLCTARYLLEQGYGVAGVGRHLEKLEELKEAYGDRLLTIRYDLEELAGIESVFMQAAGHFGKLYGMVHCAGLNRDTPVRSNDLNDMQAVMNVNCNAFIELGKYFSRKKYSVDGGSIVALSSMASLQCGKGMCTYSVSKAGLNAAVRVMAKEFAGRRIRVNAILPNFVDTPMAAEAMGYTSTNVEEFQPFGLIEPVQVAYLAEFLLSEKAAYITGSLIPVSGGGDC